MSPATGRRYPLTMICEVWSIARSTVYQAEERGNDESREPKKRGPKTELSDEALVEEIRQVLEESDFLGEGHRKVRVRLRPKGIWVGKNRVLRLMRENRLLAPVRKGRHPRGDRSHSGRITTDTPNELWGTDATRFYTKADGWCWFFGAVDHCVSDVVGWHVAKKPSRSGTGLSLWRMPPKLWAHASGADQPERSDEQRDSASIRPRCSGASATGGGGHQRCGRGRAARSASQSWTAR